MQLSAQKSRNVFSRTALKAAFGIAIGAACFGAISLNSEAQRRVVPESADAIRASYAPVVKAAAPAVVNVFVKSRVRSFRSPFRGDPFFERFFDNGGMGMPRERVQNSLGSGVIVSARGLMVTNAHVIKTTGDAEIRVVLQDKREFNARVIVQDKKSDLAILQIEGARERLPFLRFADSDNAEVGDLVLAIGNPFGVGQTVTSGIVSALARSKVGRSNNQVFIQTDAAINPGNSGGALVDMRGRLLGINTAIFSRSGGSNGIGFAIPSNLVRLYVESARSGRGVAKVWIGASLQNVQRDIAQSLGLRRVTGAIVSRIARRGPAARAGLRAQDVIVAVNDRDVADARATLYRLTTIGPGKTATLTVVRNGRRREVDIRLARLPEPSRRDLRVLSGDHPLDGVQVANPVPGVVAQLDIADAEGVIVLGVQQGGFGESLGYRRGDIIVEIAGQRISDIDDLVRVLRRRPRVWNMAIKRGRRVIRFQVRS